MTREDFEPILAALDEQARVLYEARTKVSALMLRYPSKRSDRQTQSYSQVDPSGLSKPSTACRHSGCLATADGYCDEHKGQG